MSLAIQHCAIINNEPSENNISYESNTKKPLTGNKKNKTYKNAKNLDKSREIMQSMSNNNSGDDISALTNDDDLDGMMGNFSPMPTNSETSGHQHIKKMNTKMAATKAAPPQMMDMAKEPQSYVSDYYQAPVENNYQENTDNLIVSNSELLKKLDNILHLLEEQSEEKTNYIIEELILYVFLGVFIIFVIDSFVRVGKYVR